MGLDTRRLVRTGMTYVPSIARHRYVAVRTMRRLARRPFEREFKALPSLLRRGDTVLDIGANRGQSIDAMQLVVPGINIIAFEPLAPLYTELRRRYPEVDVRPYGLSDAEQHTTVYVPQYNGLAFDGLATVDRDSADIWLRHSIYRYDSAKFELARHTCHFQRLDDLDLPAARFVKIDVQGSEEAVLRGALGYVDRHSPILLIENNDDDVPELLRGLGYHRYTWDLAGERLVPFADHAALGSFYARARL